MNHDLILEIAVGGNGRVWPNWLCCRHIGELRRFELNKGVSNMVYWWFEVPVSQTHWTKYKMELTSAYKATYIHTWQNPERM